ncbi:MAG: hypothetical protein OEX02_12280 [Cyclobacteriaceae bacterium]|nr:hypothetical protein [Cyclobacteriaceae bacterium]
MHVPFNNMPAESRVWIYQADRQLSEEEVSEIRAVAENFTAQWSAHSRDLMASCDLIKNRFLILAVNEQAHNASGCSIDASVRFVQTLEQKYQLSFLDRHIICFEETDGSLFSLSRKDIPESVENGRVTENTLTFDNLVSSIADFNSKWKKKAGETWLKKYFSNLHKSVLN